MNDHSQARRNVLIALLAALATIVAAVLGGVLAGGASYLATKEANNGVEARQRHQEVLDARAAARLVDSELGDAADSADLLRGAGLRSPNTVATWTQFSFSAWEANKRQLAISLSASDWDLVDRAYLALRRARPAFAAAAKIHDAPISKIHQGLLRDLLALVADARRALHAYE